LGNLQKKYQKQMIQLLLLRFVVFVALFSAKYIFFIQEHTIVNNNGDDKTFVHLGYALASGELTLKQRETIYSHFHKPGMIAFSAILNLLNSFLPFVIRKIESAIAKPLDMLKKGFPGSRKIIQYRYIHFGGYLFNCKFAVNYHA